MKANVTITVSHDGTAKALVATVGEIADKEFNNAVRPPEKPKFQPEKYVVSEAKFDVTGTKLVDDDKDWLIRLQIQIPTLTLMMHQTTKLKT